MGDVKLLKSEYTPLSLRVMEEALPPHVLFPFATLGADERWLYDILSEARARADRLAADYCYEFGSQLVTGRRYRAAWAMLEVALESYLGQPGPDEAQVDRVLVALAKLLDSMVPAPDAVPYLERARLIWRSVRGPAHPELAEILNNLGYVRKRRAELDAARDCYEQALAIWQDALAPEHPYLATAHNNLAALAREAGHPEEARRHYEKALAVLEDGYRPAPREFAGAYNNLGHLMLAQGQQGQARRYFERALALYDEAAETTPMEIACVLNNLAAVSNSVGDTAATTTYTKSAGNLCQPALVWNRRRVGT